MDLVQSICREALQDLDEFEYRGADSFRRWLYACAENKIRDRGKHWAREKRSPAREVEIDAVDGDALSRPAGMDDSPSHCAAAREALEDVARAFAALPKDHRRVIFLARVEGLPHEAVAREMGRSQSATRTLLSRALARLSLSIEERAG